MEALSIDKHKFAKKYWTINHQVAKMTILSGTTRLKVIKASEVRPIIV